MRDGRYCSGSHRSSPSSRTGRSRSITVPDRWRTSGPATRCAVQADWLNLPFPRASFDAAIGDGSFNCLDFPHGYRRVLRELARAIRSGGRVVVRLYVTPAACESLAEIRTCTLAGRISNVDALKWRLAH